MSQFDMGNLESPLSGTVFINGNLEPWRDALHSSHKGGSRPSYAVEGMMWVDDTTNPWVLNMFDGSEDIAVGSFDTTTNVFTPSGVSQAAEDISFDNTDSGLAATNVQDAIDEAVSDFSDFEGRADGFATEAQGDLADTALQPVAGQVVKTGVYEYTTNASISAVIAFDDSIPQNTEGTEILSTTWTMVNSSNKLRLSFCGTVGAASGGSAVATVAIFKDSVADAITAAGCLCQNSDTDIQTIVINGVDITPAAASVDIKVRAGVNAASVRFNGNVTGRKYGGVAKTVLKIEEIKV